MTLAVFLAVAAGGAVGALLRYLTSVSLGHRGPLAVLIVNVAGSFLSGVAIAAISDPVWALVVITGLCGGLTTFSTLGVETVQLVLQRRAGQAAQWVAANLGIGLLAVLAGWALAAAIVGA